MGEAANRVSETTQGRHPEIPWHKIIGMRNRLIHGYRYRYTVGHDNRRSSSPY
ncbi:MAG: DUF86 domain-containing protein [Candidatus Dadabacteria bacterium]|nr:DUF86 domain-containing protein [Candidatus Dadabacteria bacterium]